MMRVQRKEASSATGDVASGEPIGFSGGALLAQSDRGTGPDTSADLCRRLEQLSQESFGLIQSTVNGLASERTFHGATKRFGQLVGEKTTHHFSDFGSLRFSQISLRNQLRNELFHSTDVSDGAHQPSTAFSAWANACGVTMTLSCLTRFCANGSALTRSR